MEISQVTLIFNLKILNCGWVKDFLALLVFHLVLILADTLVWPHLLLIVKFFTLYIPHTSGNTSGLLGFWDGDQEKEFLLPNGAFLETNSSQSRIHYEFGQLCKLNRTLIYVLYMVKDMKEKIYSWDGKFLTNSAVNPIEQSRTKSLYTYGRAQWNDVCNDVCSFTSAAKFPSRLVQVPFV